MIVLASDLGGGKTTLVKGIAKGMGSLDKVGSPTFTLNKVYKCAGGKTLQHFDFYRLSEPGVVAMELAEFLDDPKAVVVVEWGDIVKDELPKDRLEIEIKPTPDDENARQLVFNFPEKLSYLLKDLQ